MPDVSRAPSAGPSTHAAPPPSPADLAALHAQRTGLSAKGLAALAKLQTALAWELR